jgi:hypothetical protein
VASTTPDAEERSVAQGVIAVFCCDETHCGISTGSRAGGASARILATTSTP